MRFISKYIKVIALIVMASLILFAQGEKTATSAKVLDQESVPVTITVNPFIGCSLEPAEIRFINLTSPGTYVSPTPLDFHLTANNWPVTVSYMLLSSSLVSGHHEPEIAFAVLEAGAFPPGVNYSGWIEAEQFNGYEMHLDTSGEYDYAIYARVTLKGGHSLLYQATWQITIQDAGANTVSLEFGIIVEKEKGH